MLTKWAVRYLCRQLKKDQGYYISWQANIAMAFKDRYFSRTKRYKNHTDIHNIANDAAKDFLYNLMR